MPYTVYSNDGQVLRQSSTGNRTESTSVERARLFKAFKLVQSIPGRLQQLDFSCWQRHQCRSCQMGYQFTAAIETTNRGLMQTSEEVNMKMCRMRNSVQYSRVEEHLASAHTATEHQEYTINASEFPNTHQSFFTSFFWSLKPLPPGACLFFTRLSYFVLQG